MARNKVLSLWTTIVTAFLALFTALGLVSTTAAAAVPQTRTHSNTDAECTTPDETAPLPILGWSSARSGALPPTMKQRIHAEAHNAAPSCRHRPTTTAATAETAAADPASDGTAQPSTQHSAPLQR
ncbi:DUF6344 domain-containing protein [Streptomyces sp. NPDC053750]|uniref:DUF6344 domain-containing protein n=1 Tax=Streptomyces sp. NPDC053750 TaxID=3365714 RepID=UPI0037D17271